jgi:hypothetical protein
MRAGVLRLIVQLQTSVGKVNVHVKDEFEKAKIANVVAKELKDSKRLGMFKPYEIKGWKYD